MRIVVSLILSLASTVANAAMHCSATVADLRADLALAQASIEDDEVRVAAGVYPIDVPLIFSSDGKTPTGSLTLSGGWNTFCTQQRRGAPWTRFEATDPGAAFGIIADGDILVSDLHVIGIGMALRSTLETPASTTVGLTRVAVFTDAAVGDAISIVTPADSIALDNVLIDAFANCGLAAATSAAGGRVEVHSSTFISRQENGAAVCFDGEPGAASNAATNSVFAAPEGVGVLSNGLPALLRFSAYSDAMGCPSCDPAVPALHPESVSNFEQAMAFAEVAAGDLARFTRVAHSTARIANLHDSGDAEQPFLFDVMGNLRILDARIDRGAFELPDQGIFADGFE
jgi:hypothetical protein